MTTDYRERAATIAEGVKAQSWYRIENKAGTGLAEVYLYDEIGFWGVSAGQFVDELKALDAKQIKLHINSPGGEVWDGIAILNALRDHPAKVITQVDGVAASAASFIAMAGDEVVMSKNSELMIHDAWGMAVGNASDMTDLAARLNAMSDNVASIYAEKAGGTITEWRDAMRAETWYSAEEAVAAKLADRVASKEADAAAKNRVNLSVFNYAGRAKAPDPVYPGAHASGEQEEHMGAQPDVVSVNTPTTPDPPATADPVPDEVTVPDVSHETTPAAPVAEANQNREGVGMEIDPAKLREAFGMSAETSDEEVRAAVVASGFASFTPFDEGGPQPAQVGRPKGEKPGAAREGVVMVDQSILDQLRKDAAAGQEAFGRLVRQERDATIAAAINDGKFAPSRREYWEKAWDLDPDGAKQAIASLSKGLIPVAAAGYSVDPEGHSAEDELYAQMYGADGGRI